VCLDFDGTTFEEQWPPKEEEDDATKPKRPKRTTVAELEERVAELQAKLDGGRRRERDPDA
jgi:uncharacterized small protein (DUF1192 family)